MPRGKVKFDTGSPKHDAWPSDPERALSEIAIEHGAEYIEQSLTFTPNGRIGHALFRTFEPDVDERPTNFVRLAEALDAIELCVHIDPDRWRANREAAS